MRGIQAEYAIIGSLPPSAAWGLRGAVRGACQDQGNGSPICLLTLGLFYDLGQPIQQVGPVDPFQAG